MNEEESRIPEDEGIEEPESYGWEFHKVPLLIAVILTGIFYLFVYFFVNF
ncbi:MAG: hypothetical protein ABIH23_08145 [bacterium]